MSQWTHANTSFRLNSLERIDDETLINIFGKSVDYWDEIEYDENWEVKEWEVFLGLEQTKQQKEII